MTGLLKITVGDLLDRVASEFPDREALVDLPRGKRYSYKEFLAAVDEAAKGFLKLGLKKGDHAAVWAPNLVEWVVTEFAVFKIGAVLVSVDTNAPLQQLEYVLKQSDAKTLIMAEGLRGTEYIETLRQLCPGVDGSASGQWSCSNLPALERVILLSEKPLKGALRWSEVMEIGRVIPDRDLTERQRSCSPEDVVSILYTSGTTGAPKGVMSTHTGIVNTTLASAENQRIAGNDRLCLSVPLSHMFGCICVTLAAVMKGACLVIPSISFDPGEILKAIEKERCTAVFGSPGAFIAMMEQPSYRAVSTRSLRTGIMGGAQCPMEVMKRVVEEMGAREIVIGYGQTEASSWITQTRPDDPLELRVSTVGRPLSHVEVKVIDPGSGQEVPRGIVGEICSRGLNMKGYYKMPAATASAVDSEGWLHTGDLGTMDERGYVRTTGRLKEVIRKGDETVYPTEIEEVLFSHPKVVNAQVFGVPDKRLGEEIAAWIKPEEGAALGEDEILRHCEGRLPESHLPRYIKFVNEFPMTPLGKAQKFRMREIAVKELGLE